MSTALCGADDRYRYYTKVNRFILDVPPTQKGTLSIWASNVLLNKPPPIFSLPSHPLRNVPQDQGMKTAYLDLRRSLRRNGEVVQNTTNFNSKSNLSGTNTRLKENSIKISWLVGNGRNQNIGPYPHSTGLMGSSTKSPYTLSFFGQMKLCLKRGFWRLKAEPTLTLTQIFGNLIMSLVVGSVFYNQRTSSVLDSAYC
jgi:hypothetical protein